MILNVCLNKSDSVCLNGAKENLPGESLKYQFDPIRIFLKNVYLDVVTIWLKSNYGISFK
jgi:hypothetical protein